MTTEPTGPLRRAPRSALSLAALAIGLSASAVTTAAIGGHGALAVTQTGLALVWGLLALCVWRLGVRCLVAWSWAMLPGMVVAGTTAITMVSAIGTMTGTDLWSSTSLGTLPRVLVSIGFWTAWAVPPTIGVGFARQARRDGAPGTGPPLAANAVILVMILVLTAFDFLGA